MEGGLPYGDFEGTVSYQGMGRRRLWKRVSLSVGAPLANLGGRGGSIAGDPKGYVKKGSGNGHLSSKVPSWATWIGLIYQGGH